MPEFVRKIDESNFEFTLRGKTKMSNKFTTGMHSCVSLHNFLFKVISGDKEVVVDEDTMESFYADIPSDIPSSQFNQFIDDYISYMCGISEHTTVFKTVLECIHTSKDLTIEFLKHIRAKYDITDQQMGKYCHIVLENVCYRRELVHMIVNYIISLDCDFKFNGTGLELCDALSVFVEDYIRQKQEERRTREKSEVK